MLLRRLVLGLGAAALVGFAWSDQAAALTKQEAERRLAETFGVEVIEKRTRSGEIEGRAVWFMTVMNPGGDFNAAFKVTTLAVDQETGELVPAFRHKPSGYELPGAPSRDAQSGVRPDLSGARPWR